MDALVAKQDLEVIHAVQAATTIDELINECWACADMLGVQHIVAARFDEDGGLSGLMQTVPRALTIAELSKKHPYAKVMRALVRTGEPFDSIEVEARETPKGYEPLRREYLDRGVGRFYYAVPLLSGANRIGGFASFLAGRKFEANVFQTLRALAASAFEQFASFQNKPATLPNPLTARQRQALELCGGGKSDWDISVIFGVSQATVHEHIEHAKKRLGVRTRIQAVVVAMKRGWISV